ncbi:hypothetical protein PoB_006616300 [Plakobranchus ocellatus]|uniref:Uncharacterized protein n=1 Tax=Plakobranchus ocellatus TaxID=259542 RepID=A0AAV4D630_9GAST|nr:hypothetical protein PoB_006616300 [Plakobranchus ocellatus]
MAPQRSQRLRDDADDDDDDDDNDVHGFIVLQHCSQMRVCVCVCVCERAGAETIVRCYIAQVDTDLGLHTIRDLDQVTLACFSSCTKPGMLRPPSHVLSVYIARPPPV